VAEAAKVIENTQRDINIALMNELAVIFDKLDISTRDVLAAAGTKWNFLNFTPGLVGGHCIGVDPYYLTHRAVRAGHRPEVILSGRRINDSMSHYVAQNAVKQIIRAGKAIQGCRALVLGLTFKENVSDIRNTKVVDIVTELKEFGVEVDVCDPMADAEATRAEYGLELTPLEGAESYDCVIMAVTHRAFEGIGVKELKALSAEGTGVVVDIKACFDPEEVRAEGLLYWGL
jgi:UDP-N-acetyl-D-galactosamine dehydrogenase